MKLITQPGALLTNALQKRFSPSVLEVVPYKNYVLVTFLNFLKGDIQETNYLTVLKRRQNFVDEESPQVTITKAAVERARTTAENYPAGDGVEIALGFIIDQEIDGTLCTDIVFVPESVLLENRERGGAFSVGKTSGNYHYRRDCFNEVKSIKGVSAVRMTYVF